MYLVRLRTMHVADPSQKMHPPPFNLRYDPSSCLMDGQPGSCCWARSLSVTE